MEKPKNLVHLFRQRVEATPEKGGFAYKDKTGKWVEVKYREALEQVESLAKGFLELGIQKGDRIAILSENRLEWAITDLAALMIGAIDVPIYATNTPQKIEYLLRDSESVAIVCSTEEQWQKVKEIQNKVETLRHVIVMDGGDQKDCMSFASLLEKGRESKKGEELKEREAQIQWEDLATFIYTSGTTGEPKGVMLTHGNFVSNVVDLASILPVGENWVSLSFLPLSHSFERCAGYYLMLHCGIQIYYAEDITKVPENMQEVRPHVMCSVPRLYEKMYAKVKQAIQEASPFRQKLFHWALKVGERYRMALYEGRRPSFWSALQYALADKLVFSKIRAKTGGRVQFFASGGAPLSPEIARFFYIAGLLILEGYGLTETSPVLTVNRVDRFKFGSVGLPLPSVEIRIAEDGEILARGPNVMKGYYKKEEQTREVLEPDGWFHTGDIGKMDEDGFLWITDRKKDIIVTAGGKNVAPQYIENLLKMDELIEEVVVIGDKKKYLTALIVPNFEGLKKIAKEKQWEYKDEAELIEREEVYQILEKRIQERTKELARFEQIKKFALLKEPFSEASGELTPTLKVKRKVVYEKYKALIDSLYPEE